MMPGERESYEVISNRLRLVPSEHWLNQREGDLVVGGPPGSVVAVLLEGLHQARQGEEAVWSTFNPMNGKDDIF